jgi:hypothetical protein
MRSFFKSVLTPRLMPTIRDMERDYLNASVSLLDLERRQREIDLGLFRRRSFDM